MHEKDSDEAMEKDLQPPTAAPPATVAEAPAEDSAMEISTCEDGDSEGSLAWLLDQLLNKYVPKTKPSVRQVRQCAILMLLILSLVTL